MLNFLNKFTISIIIIFSLCSVNILASESESSDKIKFSHNLHINDAEASCTDCHSSTANDKLAKRDDNDHPNIESCNSCHEEIVEEEDCNFCHTEPDDAALFNLKYLDVIFSHKKHKKREIECLSCHISLDNVTMPTISNMPSMKSCIKCHDNKTAPNSCDLCHKDVKNLMPTDHKVPLFKKIGHGISARINDNECSLCHTNSSCSDCHSGQNNLKIHDANYRHTHGIDVKAQTKDCAYCHKSGYFCYTCH